MNRIKKAEYLAQFIHEGQIRRDGDEYIVHPKRVAQAGIDKGEPENNICARWLHDGIEEAKYPKTISELIRLWFAESTQSGENENVVWELVTLLTRSKYMPYNTYILQISDNPDAAAIKLDDIIDNATKNPTEKQLLKYREACLIFESKRIEIPEILIKRLEL